MPHIAAIKALKRAIIHAHARPDDLSGLRASAATLLPLGALWVLTAASAAVSYWLTAGLVLLMSLFLLRVFVLMHECGHGSLFRTAGLNKAFGFVFGVLCGMPQYVWSKHHMFHHSTNGNWSRYRGPLNIVTATDYAAMNGQQQWRYRSARSVWLAPFGGFVYLLLNPRLTWLRGSLELLAHVVRQKIARPGVSLRAHARSFETPYWTSPSEYWHMFWNNVALLALWLVLGVLVGPVLFVVCAVVSMSLAGGAGMVLFTVQHNFEHSYASAEEGWDQDRAAVEGTSFLILPAWLNWFTANIAYHHVHHLSARIPFYRLIACHAEYEHLFTRVRRITLGEIPAALKCVLWDTNARRIVSVAEHLRQSRVGATG
ncbi:MAG: fatty acid desaturase [Burkholderiaceae bacterium]